MTDEYTKRKRKLCHSYCFIQLFIQLFIQCSDGVSLFTSLDQLKHFDCATTIGCQYNIRFGLPVDRTHKQIGIVILLPTKEEYETLLLSLLINVSTANLCDVNGFDSAL